MPKSLKRIMHVDDDVIIQKITRKALEEIGGFEVSTYGGGKEALDSLELVQPHLILIDMVMPDMEGPQALHKLREEMGILDLPVIFVTGKDAEHIELDDVTLGVIGVIKKPYKPQEIVDRIREIWDNHHA
ncbi:MAG TPA: hypothetical protein DEA55_11350 [Rhodospirillaceae bacterium]|nr:hypothetical protein [Rhodospirillaceae bacterium]